MKDPRYDFDKETDKDFLREASKLLQEKVIKLEVELTLLRIQKAIDSEIKFKLAGELLVLRSKVFDSKQEKKEKLKDLKKKKKKKGVNLIHNTNENKNSLKNNDDDKIKLFSDTVEHELDDNKCPNCGQEDVSEMDNLFEESSEFDVNTTYYILKRHKRKKYKCQCCKKIITAKGPEKLTPGGQFSVQMAIKIACDKFQYHLPLERQRLKMEKAGLEVSVKTLFSITQHLYNILYSLYEMNRKDIIDGHYVCVDESPMNFFNKSKSKGYVWSMSNNRGAYYQFEPTRSGEVAKEMIKGFNGVVVTDGYSGYNFLEDMEGIIHAYCWSHLRRYFFNAMVEDKASGTVVDYIDELYEIEHNAQSFEDLKHLRKTQSIKVYNNIVSWVEENESSYLPSNLTGKAITYFNNQKEGLTKFLTNEFAPIDNNAAERRQRCPVMGRKNYLFFRSINGADIGMFFYSLIESCKTNGLDPVPYFLDMAMRKLKSQEMESPYQYARKLKSKIQENLKKDLLENRLSNSS